MWPCQLNLISSPGFSPKLTFHSNKNEWNVGAEVESHCIHCKVNKFSWFVCFIWSVYAIMSLWCNWRKRNELKTTLFKHWKLNSEQLRNQGKRKQLGKSQGWCSTDHYQSWKGSFHTGKNRMCKTFHCMSEPRWSSSLICPISVDKQKKRPEGDTHLNLN